MKEYEGMATGRDTRYAIANRLENLPSEDLNMSRKQLPDHQLKLRAIKVEFLDGQHADGTAEGNNAAWRCECGLLLVGRCYFQFGHNCHTRCESCGRTYRVAADANKKATRVVQESAA